MSAGVASVLRYLMFFRDIHRPILNFWACMYVSFPHHLYIHMFLFTQTYTHLAQSWTNQHLHPLNTYTNTFKWTAFYSWGPHHLTWIKRYVPRLDAKAQLLVLDGIPLDLLVFHPEAVGPITLSSINFSLVTGNYCLSWPAHLSLGIFDSIFKEITDH